MPHADAVRRRRGDCGQSRVAGGGDRRHGCVRAIVEGDPRWWTGCCRAGYAVRIPARAAGRRTRARYAIIAVLFFIMAWPPLTLGVECLGRHGSAVRAGVATASVRAPPVVTEP